jgi:hypothetical protein
MVTPDGALVCVIFNPRASFLNSELNSNRVQNDRTGHLIQDRCYYR